VRILAAISGSPPSALKGFGEKGQHLLLELIQFSCVGLAAIYPFDKLHLGQTKRRRLVAEACVLDGNLSIQGCVSCSQT
jgi:hypothetical protein